MFHSPFLSAELFMNYCEWRVKCLSLQGVTVFEEKTLDVLTQTISVPVGLFLDLSVETITTQTMI
jgi:hypothetical protein